MPFLLSECTTHWIGTRRPNPGICDALDAYDVDARVSGSPTRVTVHLHDEESGARCEDLCSTTPHFRISFRGRSRLEIRPTRCECGQHVGEFLCDACDSWRCCRCLCHDDDSVVCLDCAETR